MSWLHGKPAYHAFMFGWLLSGLGRAVTGKGMRELIRAEVAAPLNTDGLHLGRPPVGAPTNVARIIGPQTRLQNPVFNLLVPRVAALPFSAVSGAMYTPGVKALVQGDTRCWTARSPHNRLLTPLVVSDQAGSWPRRSVHRRQLHRGLTRLRNSSGRTISS